MFFSLSINRQCTFLSLSICCSLFKFRWVNCTMQKDQQTASGIRTQIPVTSDRSATKADLHTFEKGSAGFVWWLGQWNSFICALLRKHPSIIYSNLLNFQVEISFVRSAKNSSPWIKVSVGYHLGTRVLFLTLAGSCLGKIIWMWQLVGEFDL